MATAFALATNWLTDLRSKGPHVLSLTPLSESQ